MTVSSTTRTAGPFTGNGVTVAFPFTFKVFTTADVLVVQTITATGVATTKTLTTDYTVALNADQNANPGGTITMLVAPPTGTTLVATSQVDNLQPVDLTNGGGFYPTVLNGALDRLTILVQQLATKIASVLQLGLGTPAGVSTSLPVPVAYKFLRWNSSANAIENATPSTANLSDYAEGSWTPTQGAGLTVVGGFFSWGQYTKVGRLVTVQGVLSGGTSVAVAAGGVLCGNLPFASRFEVFGGSYAGNAIVPGTGAGIAVGVVSSSYSVVAYGSVAAALVIHFTLTYFI
jgi:hypothetical protein